MKGKLETGGIHRARHNFWRMIQCLSRSICVKTLVCVCVFEVFQRSAVETSFVLRGGEGEGAEEERLQKSERYATEGGREGVRPPRKFNPEVGFDPALWAITFFKQTYALKLFCRKERNRETEKRARERRKKGWNSKPTALRSASQGWAEL